jgi:hypothetical protein
MKKLMILFAAGIMALAPVSASAARVFVGGGLWEQDTGVPGQARMPSMFCRRNLLEIGKVGGSDFAPTSNSGTGAVRVARRFLIGSRTLLWLSFGLATPIVLWGGWPFFQRGWVSVVNRSLNMFTLIALGTGSAYFYSVAALLFPGFIPASFRDMAGGGRIGTKLWPSSTPPWSFASAQNGLPDDLGIVRAMVVLITSRSVSHCKPSPVG